MTGVAKSKRALGGEDAVVRRALPRKGRVPGVAGGREFRVCSPVESACGAWNLRFLVSSGRGVLGVFFHYFLSFIKAK
jgi:hypothetical protein